MIQVSEYTDVEDPYESIPDETREELVIRLHKEGRISLAEAALLSDADVGDDDPQCTNCGAFRSEHGINGPCDGFTTQPGGFVVYTASDMAEMSYDEIEDLFGPEEEPDEWDPDEDDSDDDWDDREDEEIAPPQRSYASILY